MADDLPYGLEAARLLGFVRGEQPAVVGPVLHVTSGEQRAEAIARVLAAAAPGLAVAAFPPWDCLPYDWASPSAAAMGRRMAVLRRLGDASAAPSVVVTSPAAVLQRVPPVGAPRAFAVRAGEPLDLDALRRFCRAAGYREDERVDEAGEVAFRAGGADLFPAAEDRPVRVEVREGRAASIRRYDPASQRSTGVSDLLLIDAATELPLADDAAEGDEAAERARGAEHWLPDAFPSLATLLDHMGEARLVANAAALRAVEAALAQVAEAHADRARQQGEGGDSRRALPPERLYVGSEEWAGLAERRGLLVLPDGGWEALPAFVEAPRPRAAVSAFLREQAAAGRRVLLAAPEGRDGDRLERLARGALGAEPAATASWAEAAAVGAGTAARLPVALDHGFVDLDAGLLVVAVRDALGSRASGSEAGDGAIALPAPWGADGAAPGVGDVVIYEDRGAARLDGLEMVGGAAEEDREDGGEEAIRLSFAGDQVLLVPVADAGRLWRYGSAEAGVALDRLDGGGWEKRRAKVAAAIAETAKGLVAAAAERDARAARRLVPEGPAYERLVARFPYEETADQRRAVRAVLDDLAAGRPMNRLVVGDVGFGKTEVAIRATAAVAFAAGQVAVVAPTTVLARQHALTFARRFEGLGVEVAQLSRLVPAAEARRVREGLKDGRVRVVVGTHALLAKGVAFADLRLVVVDEEQRFGAAHKARLRAMGREAHVLAMTATPIPRTLQGALVGLQDLSVIATPPARRRPIRTVVADDDDATLAQALSRERRRGGQSFVVVPRVEDVEPTAERLARLLPRLRVRVAHGKLPAAEVDEAMVGFADGQGDVLLATSIIESGLDVPRANTMAVLRPDLFGLAQLHQLRGRVGRGAAQAVCLLLTRPGEALPEATRRRLGTLEAQGHLGAGLQISAEDLDQRGAGDLFGARQSGHVRLIGLALYQELLAEALRAARGEAPARVPVELRMDGAGRLPAGYVPEPEGRIELYHRIAWAGDAADVDRIEAEVADRYGPLPDPVRLLLAAARIRAAARALDVTEVSAGPQAVALAFATDAGAEERHAEAVARADGALAWVDGRLVLRRPSEPGAERAALVLDLLDGLE